jgi:hypothetical protein
MERETLLNRRHPGIVDDLVTPEVARMVGDRLVAQQDDNPFGMERLR